eukprot:407868_1
MDPSNLFWSKQLRRDHTSPKKHTVCSIQRQYNYQNNIQKNHYPTMMPNTRRYQRPLKMSELVKEVRYLKQEAMEKINLETESQKTFESMQKQIDLLQNCFESFTSMIVDECEDLRNDQMKSFEEVNKIDNKYTDIIDNSFKPICDNLSRNTSMKLSNMQNQINDLRNLILLNNKENNNMHCNCHKYNNNRPTHSQEQPVKDYSTTFDEKFKPNLPENESIATLKNTVAKQQQIIDELKRKFSYIDRNITNTKLTKMTEDNL